MFAGLTTDPYIKRVRFDRRKAGLVAFRELFCYNIIDRTTTATLGKVPFSTRAQEIGIVEIIEPLDYAMTVNVCEDDRLKGIMLKCIYNY